MMHLNRYYALPEWDPHKLARLTEQPGILYPLILLYYKSNVRNQILPH